MRSNKPDENELFFILKLGNQSVFIAGNIENDPSITNHICIFEKCNYLLWILKISIFTKIEKSSHNGKFEII